MAKKAVKKTAAKAAAKPAAKKTVAVKDLKAGKGGATVKAGKSVKFLR